MRDLSAALITAALMVATIVYGRDILVPLALAGISCFVLVPLVRWLRRRGIPRGLSQAAVLVAVTCLLIGSSVALSSQLLSLAAELPDYRTNVVAKVKSVVGEYAPTSIVGRAVDAVETYRQMLDEELHFGSSAEAPAASTIDKDGQGTKIVVAPPEAPAWRGLQLLAEPLAQAALTFLFTLFLLNQHQDLRDRIVRVVGTDNMSETTAAMAEAGERLSDLFIGQAILNCCFGLFVGVALWLIGVPNALLWGVVAMIMRWVPFIGSYLAAIPPILLAAAVDPGWSMAIATFALFAIGEPVMGQLVEPFFLGRRAGLSPFAMVLATSFWTLSWGPIGLVLAAPLTLILVVLGRYIPSLEFLSVLLGDEPPLSLPQDFYHRVLAQDTVGAVGGIEAFDAEAGKDAALDEMVFPALALASRDRRRGRLDTEATNDVVEGVEEVIEDRYAYDEPDRPTLLVLPARGAFDRLAARLAAAAINRKAPGTAIAISSSSGLTALGSIPASQAESVRSVLLLTVTGISANLAGLLGKKVTSRMPMAEVYVADLSGRHAGSYAELQSFGRFRDFINTHVRSGNGDGASAARSEVPSKAAILPMRGATAS
jgi:predicted PurR-regulated permease PerM